MEILFLSLKCINLSAIIEKNETETIPKTQPSPLFMIYLVTLFKNKKKKRNKKKLLQRKLLTMFLNVFYAKDESGSMKYETILWIIPSFDDKARQKDVKHKKFHSSEMFTSCPG